MSNRVAVIGSVNVDLVVEVPRRPASGETLLGSDVSRLAGGKGANQAAAAARSGANTRLVACVGSDPHGDFSVEQLAHAGVDVSDVRSSERPTGTALILVTPDGENSIVVSPGANQSLDTPTVMQSEPAWTGSDIVVLSLETPLETVRYVARRAAAAGVRVLINAAPAATLDAETMAVCDPLVVNEHEARLLLESDGDSSFEELARRLAMRARSVVITLGAAGSVVARQNDVVAIPAYEVVPVDTTGAGDAFVGATACELSRGVSLDEAVRFATAMAALVVQSVGAQASYPGRPAVHQYLRSQQGPV